MSLSPIQIARSLYAALEAGKHGEELRAHFTDDAVTVERPNLIKPGGAAADLESMLAASRAGVGLLARQTWDVRSAIEHGPLAIVRLTWTAEVGRDIGLFRKGQRLTAHIAQFVETRDGRVARVETYDCYEPFTQG
jgi:ketosteroid isomerase-like protein